MLKSFLIEWAQAKASVDNTTEYKEFTFRGHKVGATPVVFDNGKKIVTYLVPDTGRVIEKKHSGRFERVDLAMEILIAIRDDINHDILDNSRVEAQKASHVNAIIDERATKLEATNFSKEDIETIKALMQDTYCRRNSSYWDEYTMDVLLRYHVELSCRPTKGAPINETQMRRQYLQISRILPTDSELASSGKVYRDNYGNIMVEKRACNQWFLDKHEDISREIELMREMYTDIYNRCQTRSKFTHVLMFLASYYKIKTNMTREMILANVKKILIRRQESITRDKMPADGISASDIQVDDLN